MAFLQVPALHHSGLSQATDKRREQEWKKKSESTSKEISWSALSPLLPSVPQPEVMSLLPNAELKEKSLGQRVFQAG